MESKLLLDWIKIVGSIIISWPVVGAIALMFFRRPILKILNQFSNSEIAETTIGPITIKRKIDILSSKIEEQKGEQSRQKVEIETLRFLITNFVTQDELNHMKKLSKTDPFPFEKASYFELELRRLRSFGLINNFTGKSLRELPEKGNLKDFFHITDRGVEYLRLIEDK